ncbi:MAG: N-acetylmuramoyl-L-alanine amidase [Butyrivibrio sp.]|nr:N-acetylmuramoyl-L-alanine amidase [Butyrivibrio sp.]
MRRFKALIFLAASLMCLAGAPQTAEAGQTDGCVVIVIDAGHGGRDPGSQAVTGASEKDCNLEIALAMRAELGKYEGVRVYLTRSGDEWLTNMGRAMVARSLEADFLISLHNNSGSSSSSGCTAYCSLNPYYREPTERMCRLITDRLAALGLKNGGVLTRPSTQYDGEDYYTLIGEGIRAGVPSIIVEHCFLSNSGDAAFLTDADGTVNKDTAKKMGAADAEAVAEYFGLSKRTAAADGKAAVTLQRGSSVALTPPDHTGSVAWYSTDENTAIVDENGVATAVGSGTANIVCKLADGTTGSCTIKVGQPEPVALTGCLDPTFYESMADFSEIRTDELFGFVSYSDGTSERVTPEITGSLDRGMVGIQDIAIQYGSLTGFLRVCNTAAPYVPEVTLPQTTQPPQSSEESGGASEEEGTAGRQPNVKPGVSLGSKASDDKGSIAGRLVKYIAVLLALVFLGIFFIALESGRRRRKRNRRAGKDC